ncbi:hypothetical protein AB0N05_11935 [Nocardia sp. NPDC051030]|uniref:hypothetical protein n=1 Tax=Nocardia sp. NPDC051030 TaxID=3155162 RepID=UPI00343C740C
MIKNRPLLLAVIYIVSSIVIGPAIAIVGYLITPANGDFCDIGAHGSRAQRDHDYALLEGIQTTGSIIMLALALLLLAYLWKNHARTSAPSLVLATTGIFVMAGGYLLVFIAGTAPDATC